MRFVFTRRFYFVLAAAFVPLSVAWMLPGLTYSVLAFDVLLILTAFADYFLSRGDLGEIQLERRSDRRFAIGDPTRVSLFLENPGTRDLRLRIKDEFPPQMKLDEPR